MAIKLGDFLSKKAVNEPFLPLDDPRWAGLEGGYRGILYDASFALKDLEQAKTLSEVNSIYKELWDELHHQGDVGIASYYAVPHLVRIARETRLVDYNVLSMVTVIEIRRHKNNPKLPVKLFESYNNAIHDLHNLAEIALGQDDSLDSVVNAISAIALAKGQRNLAEAILNFDSEDEIQAFLKNY